MQWEQVYDIHAMQWEQVKLEQLVRNLSQVIVLKLIVYIQWEVWYIDHSPHRPTH
jgi:hypothetical protein